MKPATTISPEEVVLQGIGVSPGVVIGPVFAVVSEEAAVTERDVAAAEVPAEIGRFEDAIIETRRQLVRIQQNVKAAVGESSANIFEMHMMVLDDNAFAGEVIRAIEQQQKNCDAMVRAVASRYAAGLAKVADEYLRERETDVKDVSRRILRNLSGRSGSVLEDLKTPHIVIANDLSPSETAVMRKELVQGFATDVGSFTSHTAIMARSLEIPAVVALGDISTQVLAGDTILIDGTKGIVVIRPSAARLQDYGKMIEVRQSIQTGLRDLKDQPAETTDGRKVMLSANIERLEEIPEVRSHGAQGVGLFRTEYLYMSKKELPTEEEQFHAYDSLASALAPQPVIIRTFDLGGDKFLTHLRMPEEKNPFLGFRAIRWSLAQPEFFKAQLRAILRASGRGNVHIMYPMVSSVEEVIRANAILEEAKTELRQRQVAFDPAIPVGVMIEIPSAALTAEIIAPHVRFFSLGTNDLVQYTIAVDRVNDRVANLYQPTHPAVLRLIERTVAAGRTHKIWVGACGEMAGNPIMTSLLLGLGVDEFSMVPAAVPLVKDMIRKISYAMARDLAAAALQATSGEDVNRLCHAMVRDVAPELLELVV